MAFSHFYVCLNFLCVTYKIYPIEPSWHGSPHKMFLFSFLFFHFISCCFSTYWPSCSFLYATVNAQEGSQRGRKKQQIPHVCFGRQMLIFKTIHSLNKLKQARNQDGGLGRPRGIWNRVTIASRPVVQSRDTHALHTGCLQLTRPAVWAWSICPSFYASALSRPPRMPRGLDFMLHREKVSDIKMCRAN